MFGEYNSWNLLIYNLTIIAYFFAFKAVENVNSRVKYVFMKFVCVYFNIFYEFWKIMLSIHKHFEFFIPEFETYVRLFNILYYVIKTNYSNNNDFPQKNIKFFHIYPPAHRPRAWNVHVPIVHVPTWTDGDNKKIKKPTETESEKLHKPNTKSTKFVDLLFYVTFVVVMLQAWSTSVALSDPSLYRHRNNKFKFCCTRRTSTIDPAFRIRR